MAFCAFVLVACRAHPADSAPTFTRDVAPILFKHCAECHRPGETGPFPLLSYDDARRRGKLIAEVTGKGSMPPWMPDAHASGWIGERRLATNQVAVLKAWSEGGMPEGAAADLPKTPEFTEGWQLGKPDLVVEMPRTYTLAAEGKDVYRNFVVPVALTTKRHVRAVEFRPDNRRIVHHAFIKVDPTPGAREREAREDEPGFSGLMGSDSTRMPTGQILAWQPGHGPAISPEGFPWELEPGTDIVLQLHLNPTGKPEALRAKVGLYFADKPAAQKLHKLGMVSMALDIPAGEARYVVEDRFKLPVDAHVLAVLPHAHYLGHTVEATAKLPDGSTRTLIRIGDWNFNWQTDYKFAAPLQLPKGTELTMRWTFDNSSANPRNPSSPPKPVRYGGQSTDEMAELWLQLLCRPTDLAALESANQLHALRQILAQEELAVRLGPTSAVAHYNLGRALFAAANRARAALEFREALRLDPRHELAHYNLGIIAQMEGRTSEAIQEFKAALAINPDNAEIHGNLGLVLAGIRQVDEAEAEFTTALRLSPADKVAKEMLRRLREFKAAQPPAQK